MESCCLCIAISSVVFSQVFGGEPAGAVWSARCNRRAVYRAGESRNMVESAGSSVPVYLTLIFRVISSFGQL